MKSYNEWKNEKLDEIAPATDVDQMAGQPMQTMGQQSSIPQNFNMSKAVQDSKQDMRAAGMIGAKALQQAQQMLIWMSQNNPQKLNQVLTLIAKHAKDSGMGGTASQLKTGFRKVGASDADVGL
jgi:hypothetical protein